MGELVDNQVDIVPFLLLILVELVGLVQHYLLLGPQVQVVELVELVYSSVILEEVLDLNVYSGLLVLIRRSGCRFSLHSLGSFCLRVVLP